MTTVTTTTSVPPIQPASSSTTRPDPGVAPKEVATTTKVNLDPVSTSDSAVTTITITTKAQQAAASSAVFSSKKVEDIKLAIAEGRFEMNSERIADAFIREVTQLVHPKKQS